MAMSFIKNNPCSWLMSIKDFRRYIAVTYLKKGANSKAILGRPVKSQITTRSNVLPDIKFVKRQHVISKRDKQRLCNMIIVLQSKNMLHEVQC